MFFFWTRLKLHGLAFLKKWKIVRARRAPREAIHAWHFCIDIEASFFETMLEFPQFSVAFESRASAPRSIAQ